MLHKNHKSYLHKERTRPNIHCMDTIIFYFHIHFIYIHKIVGFAVIVFLTCKIKINHSKMIIRCYSAFKVYIRHLKMYRYKIDDFA